MADKPQDWAGASADYMALLKQEKELLARLKRGDEKIAAAQAQGKDTEKWDTLWVEVLHAYEEVYDKRMALEAEIADKEGASGH